MHYPICIYSRVITGGTQSLPDSARRKHLTRRL
jgi:hypothetical protein